MSSIPRFYVYVLARPNGKVFYVGKGQGARVFAHDREAKRGHKCHKCNVIRKIWSNGDEYQRYIIFTTDSEQEALDYERETIALYGRENLCNLTDGGEGTSNPSEKTLIKRKASLRKAFSTPEAKAKRSEISKRLIRTPEWRANQSAALKGKRNSPEAIERIRQKLIGRKQSADQIEKTRRRMMGNTYGVGKSQKGRIVTTDARRKISDTLKMKAPWRGKYHTPESIAKMRIARARPYIVTLPTGDKVIVAHLKTFCAEQGLNYACLVNASKKGKFYHGYIAIAAE